MSVYGICDNGCKYRVYTCEETLTLLQQAIENGTLEGINAELAAISKLIDGNGGAPVAFWVGTEAEYNALSPAPSVTYMIPRRGDNGVIYLCTDDSNLENLGGNGSGSGSTIDVEQAGGVTTLTITQPDGTSETVQIKSPVIDVAQADNVTTITITNPDGTQQTAEIKTPVKGTDYGTPEEMQQIAQDAAEIVEANVAADIDFSEWADGEFVVTMADGTEKSGEVYFDSSGKPARVTLNGHTLTLTMPV